MHGEAGSINPTMDPCIYAPFPRIYACVERIDGTVILIGGGILWSTLARGMFDSEFRTRKAKQRKY